MSRPSITIVEYNEAWPEKFVEEKSALVELIGRWAVAIEHIGSTAVPGLAAKPVIDLMVGVRTLEVADRFCLQPMAELGYQYVKHLESHFPERRFFQKDDAGGRRLCNLHMVIEGGDFWTRHLLFRDYLRTHPAVARDYEQLKRELAPQFDDVNQYAAAKTTFIQSIEKRALNWRDNQPHKASIVPAAN